jgi:hypothetical protein
VVERTSAFLLEIPAQDVTFVMKIQTNVILVLSRIAVVMEFARQGKAAMGMDPE